MYFLRGSLLLFPVARPSDALRKRSRSLSLHFLLQLLFWVEEEEVDGVGEDGRASTPSILRGERDLDPFLLLEEESRMGFVSLPLSLVTSTIAAVKGSSSSGPLTPFLRGDRGVLDLGDRGEEPELPSLSGCCMRGGGLRGRILPFSKSSSAVVSSGGSLPFSKCPLKSNSKSSTSVAGVSSQPKGFAGEVEMLGGVKCL